MPRSDEAAVVHLLHCDASRALSIEQLHLVPTATLAISPAVYTLDVSESSTSYS